MTRSFSTLSSVEIRFVITSLAVCLGGVFVAVPAASAQDTDAPSESAQAASTLEQVEAQNLFGFWFAGESERQCGENGTTNEVRSRGYGPRSGPICSPLKPLAAQSKKSKQVLSSSA